MKFDIQINLNVDADNELEAEELITDILNEMVVRENKINQWDFVEYISEDFEDTDWQ